MARIPKKFHFLFGLKEQIEPFHLAWYLCLASCRAVNPDHRILFHYLNEPHGPWWDRIKPELELRQLRPGYELLDTKRYADHQEGRYIEQMGLGYAHQSDLLRLQILAEHGGIYADIDTLFVRPYPASWFSEPCVMGLEAVDADPPTLCNAVIMAESGSLFVCTWLKRLPAVFDGTWNRHSCIEPARISEELPAAIRIVEPRSFFHFKYDRPGLTNLFGRVSPIPDDLHSIHMWNHLWWEPTRNDFIAFNHTHLTSAFIRKTDTTYNLIARQYIDKDS